MQITCGKRWMFDKIMEEVRWFDLVIIPLFIWNMLPNKYQQDITKTAIKRSTELIVK